MTKIHFCVCLLAFVLFLALFNSWTSLPVHQTLAAQPSTNSKLRSRSEPSTNLTRKRHSNSRRRKKGHGNRLHLELEKLNQDEDIDKSDWSLPENYQSMELDTPATQKFRLLTNPVVSALFKVRIPRNAKTMTFTINELPVYVSMYGLHGNPMFSTSDSTDENPAEEFKISVSRYDYIYPLEGGMYYFAVVVDSESIETMVAEGVKTLDITATVNVNLARIDGQLELGKKIESSLSPEVGCFRTFELQVPEDAETVRIDLNNANADLNLAVRQRRMILDTRYANTYSEDLESREYLVLRKTDFPNLTKEKWFIDVFAPYNASFTDFEIYATLGEQAPKELLELPKFDLAASPAENAMMSTVQIGSQTGSASGTLVSSDGLILTNYHVISESSQFAKLLKDESQSDVVIAMSTQFGRPPVEYFLGEVIHQSRKDDLALVKIKSGYYGQPLPDDYQFPHVKCRIPGAADLGKPIHVAGYPLSGCVENNPTLNISSGVLSGSLGGRYLKTDADLASGNSGGAAFDQSWKLIGIPTMTIDDPNATTGPTIGILMQLGLVPESWGVVIEK